jgi:hypothetical protein
VPASACLTHPPRGNRLLCRVRSDAARKLVEKIQTAAEPLPPKVLRERPPTIKGKRKERAEHADRTDEPSSLQVSRCHACG